MSQWSNLPNAAHIDRVLAHMKAHPDKWVAARDAAYDAAWVAARDAAWVAAWVAVQDTALGATWVAARDTARGAARDACVALVAWDEAGDLLSAPVATVRFLAQEEVHAAVLLLPAVIAMEGSLDTVK